MTRLEHTPEHGRNTPHTYGGLHPIPADSDPSPDGVSVLCLTCRRFLTSDEWFEPCGGDRRRGAWAKLDALQAGLARKA